MEKQHRLWRTSRRFFKHLLWILFIGALCAGVAIWFSKSKIRQAEKEVLTSTPINKPLYIYEWRDFRKLDTKSLIDNLQAKTGVGNPQLFLTLNPYLDAAENTNPVKRAQFISSYEADLRQFVRTLEAADINVHAVVGAPKFGDENLRYLTTLATDFVHDFNAHGPERIRSVNFDIEPYTSSDYKKNPTAKMQALLQTIQLVVNHEQQRPPDERLSVGFTLPFWLIHGTDSFSTLDFNNSQKYVSQHAFDLLSVSSANYAVIMAYRDQSEGKGGTIDVVDPNFSYVASKHLPIRLIVGQEVGPVKPDKTTYWNKGLDQFHAEVKKIENKYHSSANYGGVSVNDEMHFEQM